MVSFELGKEIEKDVFRLVTNVGQRKNSESPGSIPHKDSEFFLCLTLVIRWKTSFLISIRYQEDDDENKEKYQLGNYKLIRYQILRINITWIVWEIERRTTYEI